MAEAYGFSRSGVNSGSIGNHCNLLHRIKMEKKVTQRASVTVCVPGNIAPWLLSVRECTEKSDEPIICKLLRGNLNLSISTGDIL